jgi:Mg2+-importing ATPase
MWRSSATGLTTPSLLLAVLGVVTVGAVLPATPLVHALGFQPMPSLFFFALTLMVASYLVLIEIGKRWFYRTAPPVPASRERTPYHRLLRRAARFTTASASHLPRPVPRQ